ncbi:MAG: DNA replication and repair protein RecF [Ignavibacteria bacterium]|nr:DNA replication and repair protein RecF [Ignavibacteria bacterium]
MIVRSLSLRNFRIHQSSSIDFSDTLNFIVGGNGEGKTSLLEGLYFLCTTRNFKAAADNELLRFGEESYEVNGIFQDTTIRKARIYYSAADTKRHYLLDGKSITRATDVIGKFPVVLLTPEDHQLTQGGPADRRKFIDSVISQSNVFYLSTLIEYNRIIKQRSALLNLLREQRRHDYLVELDAWDELLVKTGTTIIEIRQQFIEEFNQFICEAYSHIMPGEEQPVILYPLLQGSTEIVTESIFAERLAKRREEEIRRAANLTGPHRDDFIFMVNNTALKTYGSQGQHKTFQTALRFAEFFYLKMKAGTTPIFLLDDVFGELDTKRSSRISEYLKTVGQAFITITDFSNYRFLAKSEHDATIMVSRGSIGI